MKALFVRFLRILVIALPWAFLLRDKPFWLYFVIAWGAIGVVQLLVELEGEVR